VRVLLVSTYEMGHQPLHVASPAAALLRAGHEVRALDLAVQRWPDHSGEALRWAEAVGLSVPMHTAMRLAALVAGAIRQARPQLPICLYGLYAPVSRDRTVARLADRAIAGEYEPALLNWVEELGGHHSPGAPAATIHLDRSPFTLPARHLLPPLDHYAHLELEEEHRLVGYVEASHGCSHRCRHCPVPVVYQGRSRALSQDVVLADVAQLVSMGARHITFGDPDFLNRPQHARRVTEAVHHAFPDITFDLTVKVEHILRHEGLWPEMARLGCLFVVSAFESTDDATLARLDKGHTVADESRALAILRSEGIDVRPSWLPFTPWTTLGQVLDLVDFVAAHDLVGSVDPVQYSIRLLLPQGSLLLERADLATYLGPYDAEGLTWTWRSPDARVDTLQRDLAELAQAAARAGEPIEATYERVRHAVATAAGWDPPSPPPARGGLTPRSGTPRLTEPWFC
jgi:radical SAM superfamily enzyme YgiQ (UPF0313 family)